MDQLHLKVLGRFEALHPSGEPISLPTRKTEALLTYLALVPGPHPRDHLTNLLWSDRGEQQARNSLRQALNALKKMFSDIEPQPLLIDRNNVNLASESMDVDAMKLEELVQDQLPQAFDQATKLYRGEFLEGLVVRDPNGEEWLAGERDRYRGLAIQSINKLITCQLEQNELDAARDNGEKLVGLDRLNESAWRKLMQVYAVRRERNNALKAYKRCTEILKKELGVEPMPETAALHAEIRDETTKIGNQIESIGQENSKGAVSGPMVAAGLPKPERYGKPSIVVLPFVCIGEVSDADYFADCLTDDLIAILSHYRELFVIHAESSFTYHEGDSDSASFTHQLGVGYVAKGNIRRDGEKIRISVQLINAATGKAMWAERIDRDFTELSMLEDEVAAKIAASLVSHIEDESSSIAARKTPKDLNAYDCVIRGRDNAMSYDPDENQAGRKLLEKAVQIDPEYARAYAHIAESLCIEADTDWCQSRQETIEKAVAFARKAIALDEFDSVAHEAMGQAYLYQGKHDLAGVHLDRAIDCNPNSYNAYCIKSWVLALSGRASEVPVCGSTALHLNPLAPDDCLLGMIIAYYLDRRYEDAIELASRIHEPSEFSEPWRAACLAQLGRKDEAQLAAANATEMSDGSVQQEEWLELWAFKNPDDRAHLMDGLKKSGVIQDLKPDSEHLTESN